MSEIMSTQDLARLMGAPAAPAQTRVLARYTLVRKQFDEDPLRFAKELAWILDLDRNSTILNALMYVWDFQLTRALKGEMMEVQSEQR